MNPVNRRSNDGFLEFVLHPVQIGLLALNFSDLRLDVLAALSHLGEPKRLLKPLYLILGRQEVALGPVVFREIDDLCFRQQL